MTATFQITSLQVMTGAMQCCLALGQGEAPTTSDKTDLTLFLQAMLKSWHNKGYKNWLFSLISFPMVANKRTYTIAEAAADVVARRPVRVPQAYTQDANGNKTPLIVISRGQLELLTPVAAVGPPNSLCYDPLIALATLYFWPVPTDASLTAFLLTQRPIEDLAAGDSATFDIPQEVYLALIWCLAEQAMDLFGTPERQKIRIEKKAATYLSEAMDFLEEEGSVFFMPDPRGGFGYGRR